MENITDISKIEEKLANAKSDEEAIQIFAEAGMQVTAEQLAAEDTGDELDETALDDVSGGSVVITVAKYLIKKYLESKRRMTKRNSKLYGGSGAFGGGGGGGR